MPKIEQEQSGVSVIVPCFNAGAFINETIDSILRQKADTPYEIIVVDDGSTDALTLKRIGELETLQATGNFPLKVIRHDTNRGLSATRNTAIRYAQYDKILPLDSDDKLVTPQRLRGRPGMIDQGARVLDNNPDIDVVSPQAYFFGNVEGKMRYPEMHERRLMYKCHIPVFSMIRKSALDAVGGYNEDMRFAEDWDLWVALANRRRLDGRPGGFHRIDEHLVDYRTHANTSNLSASFKAANTWPYEQMLKRSPEIFEHHFPHVPRSVLPHVLLAHKVGYIGKLAVKSAWSENAATFIANKRGTAKALISELVRPDKDPADSLGVPENSRR